MSLIQLYNLATSLASNSAFLACHIFTEFFCVMMQSHFIRGLNLIISLVGYFSLLLPCTLSFKKESLLSQIIYPVYKVVPQSYIKGAEQTAMKAGNKELQRREARKFQIIVASTHFSWTMAKETLA